MLLSTRLARSRRLLPDTLEKQFLTELEQDMRDACNDEAAREGYDTDLNTKGDDGEEISVSKRLAKRISL